jgi:hypothetical protein
MILNWIVGSNYYFGTWRIRSKLAKYVLSNPRHEKFHLTVWTYRLRTAVVTKAVDRNSKQFQAHCCRVLFHYMAIEYIYIFFYFYFYEGQNITLSRTYQCVLQRPLRTFRVNRLHWFMFCSSFALQTWPPLNRGSGIQARRWRLLLARKQRLLRGESSANRHQSVLDTRTGNSSFIYAFFFVSTCWRICSAALLMWF